MKSIAISKNSSIVQDFIEREQAKKMIAMYNSVFAMQLILGTAFVIAAYDLFETLHIAAWFLLHVLLLLLRKWLINWHLQNSDTEILSKKVERGSLFLVACSSLLWGSTAFALDFVHYPQESVFILAINLGIGVGATVLGAVWYRYFYYYLIPFMTLFVIAFIAGVPQTSYLLVFVYIAFALFALRTVNISYRNTIEHLSLIKENEILVQTTNQFIAAASHDLRQPSQALSLLISALEESHEEVNREKLIGHLKKSSSTLNDLLNNILDVSKLNSETFKPELSTTNLQEIFRVLNITFQPKAEAKNVSLYIDGSECWVQTDSVMIERLLFNLVDNAIRYTDIGFVEVRSETVNENQVKVIVSDSGIGIAKDEQTYIFEPFYQIHNNERNSNKGFGLGLSIVNRISQKLDIDLHFESTEGQGTSFSITLCQSDKPILSQDIGQAKETWSLSNKNILIIEDNETVLEGLIFQVSAWGMNAISATNIQEAFDKTINHRAPDILLSDYRLQDGENGMDVIDKLRKKMNIPDVPAIILSGDTAPDIIDEVSNRGFMILHKPTKPAHLRSVIQRCILAP
ncbi:hybrid sensor histidine kinase/response regulator [Alteromonas facilis]|uniref:ATP-binding response regulator n=1 Tax=Alteromonas facilis TaxID=2048004 RepID=UPI0013DB93B6|nr:hybrid sensor histidine kinase/response regulator [Alteromonas facilis]